MYPVVLYFGPTEPNSRNNAKTLFSSIQVLFSQSLLLALEAVVQRRVSVLARPRVQVGAVTVVGHHTSFAAVAIKIFTELAVGASIQTAIGPRSVPPSRSPGDDAIPPIPCGCSTS